MGSSRLPKKALMDIDGTPSLKFMIDRVKKSKLIDKIIVATTNVLSATGSAICPNLDCHENFLAKNPSRKSDIPAKKNIPKAKKNCSSNMKIMRGYTERSRNTVSIFGMFENI